MRRGRLVPRSGSLFESLWAGLVHPLHLRPRNKAVDNQQRNGKCNRRSVRLRCSQRAVSNSAQDDNGFWWVGENGQLQLQRQVQPQQQPQIPTG
jgi:hypothetical protein